MDLFGAQSVGFAVMIGLVTIFILGIYNYSLSLSSKPGVPDGQFWQLPFVGETISMFRGSFEDFIRHRVQRYGTTFRSHLLGGPCIVATDFDTIKFVLQSPHLFKRTYNKSIKELIAREIPEKLLENKAVYLIRVLSREGTKNFISELDKHCKDLLTRWEKMESVALVNEFEKYAFTAASIFNCDYIVPVDAASEEKAEKFRALYFEMRKGVTALPVDIPGTAYHNAKVNRRNLVDELLPFIVRRRGEKGTVKHSDTLDAFVNYCDTYSDAEIAELIISFIFAGEETTCNFLIWVMIDLMSNPEVIDLLREENERLAEERRSRSDDTITHADIYEKLTMTNQVVKETLRKLSISSFLIRETTDDVVHKGVFFPKGWKVITSSVRLHADPQNHRNPEAYDPSRFSDATASKTEKYMPFGYGPNFCKGQEAFKVEVVIFLHHLMANYEFKPYDGSYKDISPWPRRRPRQVVRIIVSKRRPERKL